ncbi:MAG TPA: sulfotransferase domain-containing protein [Aestuariivirga sp.]
MTGTSNIPWPTKSRDIFDHHIDSTAWNDFRFRDSDIIIATYPKSGTSWGQQIIAQLLFHGAEGVKVSNHSFWIEVRVANQQRAALIEAQTHRRFLKTHLPVDALVFSPKAKYIYIGRDGRDVAWSLFNHYANASDAYFKLFNDAPGRIGPPLERVTGDVHDFYGRWFSENGYPTVSLWENVRSWWMCRELPNVKLVHFNDLKADLAGSIRSIAAFLEIRINERAFPRIVEHCTFDYMKAHAELVTPSTGNMWRGGAKTFINKGSNNRWLDTLSAAETTAYEAKAVAELGPECAKWLAHGGGA